MSSEVTVLWVRLVIMPRLPDGGAEQGNLHTLYLNGLIRVRVCHVPAPTQPPELIVATLVDASDST